MVDYRANRTRDFKKGIDSEKGRRNRNDTRLQLRKNKKEESLQKRRAMAETTVEPVPSAADAMHFVTENTVKKTGFTAADVPSLADILRSKAPSDEDLLQAITGFRKMLSIERNPPVKEVIDANVLPHFIQMLAHTNDKIKFEAAWALTNVASTEFTRTVCEYGAIPPLVGLLMSGNPDVREQCAWCLGNIAGDAVDLRDLVLEANAMDPMLKNISNPANESLLGNVTWALSNFCRGKPQPRLDLVAPALPYLTDLLTSNKMSVLPDVCWALSYISDGDDDRIDAVMNTGITPRLISMLTHADAGVVTPVLRTLGNFVSGNERQTQAVVNAGIIDVIPSLLNHPKKNIRKEACWLLSNIAAGNSDQISAVISKASMMQTVLNLLEKAEWDVRKEAAWVVSNIATGGLTSHVHDLVEFGAINALCSVISAADPKILLVILDAIGSILRVGKSSDRDYAGYVDECDGLDAIENLQTHENDNVYEKAVAIIETYFGVEEGEDENLVPEVHGDTFSFGLTVNKATDGIQQQQAPLQPFNF